MHLTELISVTDLPGQPVHNSGVAEVPAFCLYWHLTGILAYAPIAVPSISFGSLYFLRPLSGHRSRKLEVCPYLPRLFYYYHQICICCEMTRALHSIPIALRLILTRSLQMELRRDDMSTCMHEHCVCAPRPHLRLPACTVCVSTVKSGDGICMDLYAGGSAGNSATGGQGLSGAGGRAEDSQRCGFVYSLSSVI